MQLQKLIAATGIKKIIWIDDDFSEKADQSDCKIEVKQHIEAVLELDDEIETKKLFNELGVERDASIEGSIHAEELDDWFLDIDEEVVKKFAEDNNLLRTDIDQMVEYLKKVDNVEVLTFCFADWEANKEDVLKSQERKLFLVDKEFEKEGLDKNVGFEIIKAIHAGEGLSRLNQCVLFTHKVANNFEEEDKTRLEYLAEINDNLDAQSSLKPPAFMVMSKARINGEEFTAVEQGLHSIFIRKTLYSLAIGLAEEAERSSVATIEKLMKANVVNADKVFFESTRTEGVSEVELLHRIFTSEWKKSLYSYSLREESLSELILQGRRISAIRKEGELPYDNDMELFHDLRKGELWVEGDILNKNYLPIRCGDIFEIEHFQDGRKEQKTTQSFVLVAPPCELMVRKTGVRKLKDAVLIPIREKKITKKTDLDKYTAAASNFVFKEVANSNNIYILNLGGSVSINLASLDLCSFNDDGSMKINADTKVQEHMVPAGSYLRFLEIKKILECGSVDHIKNSAIGRIFNSPIPLLSSPEPVTLTEMEIRDGSVSAPIVRVRRLSEQLAEQVLSAYYAYRSRKAMEYDFTTA